MTAGHIQPATEVKNMKRIIALLMVLLMVFALGATVKLKDQDHILYTRGSTSMLWTRVGQ